MISLLFFRVTLFGLKDTVSTTSFTMIEWAAGRVCAIFDKIFALTFATGVNLSLNRHN